MQHQAAQHAGLTSYAGIWCDQAGWVGGRRGWVGRQLHRMAQCGALPLEQ